MNLTIIFWNMHSRLILFFHDSNSQYQGEKEEMILKIRRTFQKRSISIIMNSVLMESNLFADILSLTKNKSLWQKIL